MAVTVVPGQVLLAPAHQARAHRCQGVRSKAAKASAGPAIGLPPALEKIVTLFRMVPDAKLKYQQLLAYAKQLPVLPPELHTTEHKVQGCVSQVWVVGSLDDQGNLSWRADSDSALTKGLAALLVQGLSGVPPEMVVKLDPEWISQMGLQQSLTPSRNNGFFNMFKLMQQKSLELLMVQERGPRQASASASEDAAGTSSSASAVGSAEPSPAARGNGASAPAHSAGTPAAPPASSTTPVRDSMDEKLRAALQPSALTIHDESAQHAGHAAMRHGHAGSGGETHFRIQLISSKFEGLKTMQRHRLVYQVLKEELAGPVHALSLETKSPAEA
ncbi:hypothetical protein WJX73_001604 [Symbiochloris irregularis]|uniref:Fe-S metabolism associated domain-containing protein n=1 Tax=Symbiochloris irregularis TaxID=706552 RepID=A0AAW1NPB2_9CHLO